MIGMDHAMKMARDWMENPAFDEKTRAEAARIAGNGEECLSAFGAELQFGTGGLRGILGTGTNRMNPYTVGRATLGLARYLGGKGKVVLAHDSRIGSEEFTRVAAQVLAREGVKALVFDRLAPTPMLSFAVRELGCDAGIMITASHNPAEYNGYKVYGPDGCQITDAAADAITAEIEKLDYISARLLPEEEARAAGLWEDVPEEVRSAYARKCLSCRVDPAADAPIRVVYTPLHGAGLEPVRQVLGSMSGVQVIEVEEQCIPDGHFPTCPKPNPELDQALALGLKKARETQAELLLATDPDSDRMGVVLRRPDGSYEHITGNEAGLLLLDYVLSARQRLGTLPVHPVMVKTIVTSDLAFPIAQAYGCQVKEVLIGFKYIGETIARLEEEGREGDYVFGMEESCGYLGGTHVRDKDGPMACMLFCEMAQSLKSQGTTPWERLQALYARYGFLCNRLLSFEIRSALPMEDMKKTMARFRENPPETLAGQKIHTLRDYLPGLDGLPQSNVLSYAGESLKVILRPSGTEPKIKVYLMASTPSREETQALLDRLEGELNTLMRL